MALEELYFGAERAHARSPSARRAASCCSPPASAACPARSYTPQQVKGAVCGNGRAGKDQVARMVAALLGAARAAAPDHAADALAVAICHAQPRAAGARRWRGRGAMIALLRGEVAVRRADHVVVALRRRRLPAGGLGRDAAPRARRSASR